VLLFQLLLLVLLVRLLLPSSPASVEVGGLEGWKEGGLVAFLLVHVEGLFDVI